MNMVLVYANLSATTLRNASGQKADCSGPRRHLRDLSAACLSLSSVRRFDSKSACRPGRQFVIIDMRCWID